MELDAAYTFVTWIAIVALIIGGFAALKGLPRFLNKPQPDPNNAGEHKFIRALRWYIAIGLMFGLCILCLLVFNAL